MLPVPGHVAGTNFTSAPLQTATSRIRQRIVLIASSDASQRDRLRTSLAGLRWQVFEAPGGAEAWAASEDMPQLEALLIDAWLPDLDVEEFLQEFHRDHPHVEVMMTDGTAAKDSPRSAYRQELLYALRRSQDGDTTSLNGPVISEDLPVVHAFPLKHSSASPVHLVQAQADPILLPKTYGGPHSVVADQATTGKDESEEALKPLMMRSSPLPSVEGLIAVSQPAREVNAVERIPTLIGSSSAMLEVSRRIRLVAARTTPVLIEGPTGSGKELVAAALHRLSTRSRKAFVAINCAAIPEALLEAELFGHTRGAFTGAVQGRTGRIEAADGGTLFLDEIGEMPLALQSKLLRFVESGELQRIGDNETVRVDARIIAATHQPLAEDAHKGHFRADLYYRLAVFLIRTPALLDHMEDLPQLVAHFMQQMGKKSPVKRVDASAMAQLVNHGWPGNVRELEHVLERAAILAGDSPLITASEIDFGLSMMN